MSAPSSLTGSLEVGTAILPAAAASVGHEISEASRQLRALALLSGSLTDPLTPEDASAIVERQALAALGATSAVIVTRGRFPPNDYVQVLTGRGDGRDDAHAGAAPGSPQPGAAAGDRSAELLSVVHAIGVPAPVASALHQLRLDAAVPLAEVARSGEPLFLRSAEELRRYPEWCIPVLAAGSNAAAAVPVWANGRLRGVLGLTWATPRPFDEDERAFVSILGVMCAQAIMRGHLIAAERQARTAAVEANSAKSRFLRTMSHELRTPLTAVVGYTALLADEIEGPVTPVQRAHLRRIGLASSHLLALIEELLHFAQLDAGREVIRSERVLAAAVVDETLDIVRPLGEHKGVHLRFERPPHPLELDTDRLKLRQILVNLAANAVKFTDAGDVVLRVRTEGSGPRMRIRFEVTDSGRGITAEDQRHLFEAFWQGGDQSLTRQGGGTGLGLSVARELARLLGGEVFVEKSEVGQGSTFVAAMPPQLPVVHT